VIKLSIIMDTMKRAVLGLILVLFVGSRVAAQGLEIQPEATSEAEATQTATPSGIVERVVEKKSDLTESSGQAKSKLEAVLEENPVESLTWSNPMRYAIFQAVKNGVPVNTLVLVLLFPLVAALVVASRHLIGLRGLGIFTPSLLSIGLLASGIGVGVVLFATILAVATFGRFILKRLKLQYLPRVALLLWFVSLGVFGAMVLSGYFGYAGLVTVGIFPILILILLAESFLDVQVGRSFREAASLVTDTLILAIITSFIIGLFEVQKAVLLYPELVFFGVGIFDYFMAKYVGLRLVEYLKFRSIFSSSSDDEE